MAALALLGLAWLGSGTARAAFPGENGLIAFARGGDIWAMNADGSNRVRMVCSAGFNAGTARLPAGSPAWSPDGRRIAFVRSEATPHLVEDVFVLNPDGSQTELTFGGGPTWSPDGQRLARHGDPDFGGGISTIDADGSDETLIPDTEGGLGPAWSPDGERIAFSRRGDIHITNLDGTDQTRIDFPGFDAGSPAWSPDGQQIAFGHRDGIWLMNPDGSDQTRLTHTAASDQSPAWSPDGQRIAFTRVIVGDDLTATANVWTMNADGTDQVNATRGRGGGGSNPDWQPLPEGSAIAPPRQFCLDESRRNTRRGIVRLAVTVPRPGRVVLQQRPGVKRFAQAHRDEGAGRVVLRVRPRGKAARRLARAGRTQRRVRVRVRAQVTFRPWVGEPETKGRRVWLVRVGNR